MKTMKRVLSLLLAVFMLTSIFVVAASAASASNVKRYKTYTALGDSVGAGFGQPDYNRYGKRAVYKERIEGSWTCLVADAVQADTFYPMSFPGYRSAELRLVLDNSYNGDAITDNLIELADTPYQGNDIRALRGEFQQKVKKADLISLECGLNDTWLPLMASAWYIRNGNALSDSYEDVVTSFLSNFGSLGDAMKTGYGLVQAMVTSPIWLAQVAQTMAGWLPQFMTDYQAIVKQIVALNPKATIVATGVYNPFREWDIPEGSGLALLNILNPMYDIINNTKKQLANEYPGQYYFADISATEANTKSISAIFTSGGFDPHPSTAGHKYIAAQVLNQLPTGKRASKWSRKDAVTPVFSKGSKGWGTYDDLGYLRPCFSGIARSISGKLYYVKDGLWAKSFNGVVYNYGTKKRYYIRSGRVATDYSGTLKISGKTYTVKNGIATQK